MTFNQIATATGTIAVDLCRKAGRGFVISHRSGETEDAFMVDFAVAMGGAATFENPLRQPR